MSNSINVPIDSYGWLVLRNLLGKKVIIRAGKFRIRGAVTDTDGHAVQQAEAESGVKLKGKSYDLIKF